MRRRTLTNLVLCGLVAALAAVLAFTGPAPKKPDYSLLTDIDAKSIDNILLVRAGSADVRIQREGTHWNLTGPVHVPAAANRIKALLGLLRTKRYARFSAAGEKLSRFGLDNPRVTLKLGGHRFDFGDTNPLDDKRYVLYAGSVYLVDDYLYFQLAQNAGFFADPSLLPHGSRPERIVYPDSTLFHDNGAWKQRPATGRSETDLKSTALNWETARAITVHTLRKAPVHGKVSVELEKGGTVTFEIVGNSENPVLARPDLGLEYHLDSYTAKQLLLKPEQQGGKESKKKAGVSPDPGSG